MKRFYFIIIVIVILGCGGKTADKPEQKIKTTEVQNGTEQVIDTKQEVDKKTEEETANGNDSGLEPDDEGTDVKDEIEYKELYKVGEIPDYIYFALCGAWTREKTEGNAEREFSWGKDKYDYGQYLIIDLGAKPPILILGNSEGGSVGFDIGKAEILSIGILEENKYRINFRSLDTGKEKYFIVNLNPDGSFWLEEAIRFYLVPGRAKVWYKTSGPKTR